MQRPTKVPTQLGRDLRPLKPRCDEPPHEQDYYRANDCADEPSALASLIPPDRLPKVRCYNSSNNPEHGRPDEPGGFILISRINQLRDYPCHKPNYDGPKNTHCALQLVQRRNNLKLSQCCDGARRRAARLLSAVTSDVRLSRVSQTFQSSRL